MRNARVLPFNNTPAKLYMNKGFNHNSLLGLFSFSYSPRNTFPEILPRNHFRIIKFSYVLW